MNKVALILAAIGEWTGKLIAWLTLVMVLVVFGIVILRYGFNLGWVALQESVTYMHAMVFMLGAAYTLKHDGHVRIDLFYCRMSDRSKLWVNNFGIIFFLLPMCIFILWTSWDYVVIAWKLKEGSREAGGLPFVYYLKTLLIIMPVLVMLQGLSQLFDNLQELYRS